MYIKGENNIYEESLMLTTKGRVFASSWIILFRYMREEAGIGWDSAMLVLIGAVAATIVIIGIITGAIVIPSILRSIYEWGCDILKLSCQIKNGSTNF